MVAVTVAPNDVTSARSMMQGLAMGGQRRVHFKTERDSRKKQIKNVICGLGVTATAYVTAPGRGEVDARRACIESLIADHGAGARLVIETDDSMLQHDRRALFDARAKAGSKIEYLHQRAHEEPLLWIPDALAWCLTAGGHWRRGLEGFVTELSVEL